MPSNTTIPAGATTRPPQWLPVPNRHKLALRKHFAVIGDARAGCRRHACALRSVGIITADIASRLFDLPDARLSFNADFSLVLDPRP